MVRIEAHRMHAPNLPLLITTLEGAALWHSTLNLRLQQQYPVILLQLPADDLEKQQKVILGSLQPPGVWGSWLQDDRSLVTVATWKANQQKQDPSWSFYLCHSRFQANKITQK